MKFLRLTTLLPLFFCALFSVSAQTEEWHTFTSKDLGFSARFPGVPEQESEPVAEDAARLHTVSYGESEDPPIAYIVQVIEFPASLNLDEVENVSEFFEGFINGMISDDPNKLLSQTVIEKDGFPGREVRISIEESAMIGTLRTYLVRGKTYTVMAISLPEDKDHSLITHFLDSFALLK